MPQVRTFQHLNVGVNNKMTSTYVATGFCLMSWHQLVPLHHSWIRQYYSSVYTHTDCHTDTFAVPQVGVEKTKVNLENEAAQVEAEKCGVIAKDVTELQARCEKDLAAAEPLVAQAEAALDTLNKKDLGWSLNQSPQYSRQLPNPLYST